MRFGTLGTQYFDSSGNVLGSGTIAFYDTTTGLPKQTYADAQQQIANTVPVRLTADGRQPNIFISGQFRAILRNNLGTVIDTKDPLGDTASTSFGVTRVQPTRPGDGFTAPDARLLEVGTGLYSFANDSMYYYAFFNDEGDTEFFIPPFGTAIVTLADNTTQAGTWSATGSVPVGVGDEFSCTVGTAITSNYRMKTVALDADRDAVIFWGAGAAYVIGRNHTTGETGEPELIRTTPAGTHFCQAIKSSTDAVLICFSVNGSADVTANVATFVGVVATVNATTTKTLSGVVANIGSADPEDGRGIIESTSNTGTIVWLVPYVLGGGTPGILHILITGTVPTVANQVDLTGATDCPFLFNISTAVVLAVTISGGANLRFRPVVVGPTAATLGTETTVATTAGNLIETPMQLAAPYLYMAHRQSSNIQHIVATCSTTAVTANQAAVVSGAGTPSSLMMTLVGNQAIIAGVTGANAGHANVMTNTAGTPSAGVVINLSYSNLFACAGYSDTELFIAATDGTLKYRLWSIGITGANPVLKAESTAAGLAATALDSLATTTMAGTRKIYNPNFSIGRKHTGRTVSAGSASRYLSYTGRTTVKLEAYPESSDAYWKPSDETTWSLSSMTQGGTGWVLRRINIT